MFYDQVDFREYKEDFTLENILLYHINIVKEKNLVIA